MRFLNNDLKIIHRDLKGDNILLHEEDDTLNVKVGDFGGSYNSLIKYGKIFFDNGTLGFKVKYLILLFFWMI